MTQALPEVTGLLRAWAAGDDAALSRLTDLLLPDLRRIAHRFRRDERETDGLQTTAVVNEVYLRLCRVRNIEWQNRGQFFVLFSQLVRHLLVDAARKRASQKRGGMVAIVAIEQANSVPAEPDAMIVAVDDALRQFAQIAPRQAKVVELRYFGGLSEDESAEAMQTSLRTVRRDWQFAKAWLTRELSERGRGTPDRTD